MVIPVLKTLLAWRASKKESRCSLFLWSRWDSNPLPFDCEPNALPDELLPRFLSKKGRFCDPLSVEYIGVEPMTSCMPCKRSSLLS